MTATKGQDAKHAVSQGRQRRPQSAGTTAASSQDRRPKEPGRGPIRQSLAVVTIGAVMPNQRSSGPPQGAGRTGAPAGNYVSPRTTDYVRTSVVELAARSEQAERSL
jgi:hypothetical protein